MALYYIKELAWHLQECGHAVSVVNPGRIHDYARSKLRRAIVEEGVQVPAGTRREDLVAPRRVTAQGVLVVTGEPRPTAAVPMAMTP